MINRNTNLKWLNQQQNIIIDKKDKSRIFDTENPIRGIYGIFIMNKGFENCIYVGRSNSIYDRFFKNGHISRMKKGTHSSCILNDAVSEQKIIIIKVLKEVPFIFDNYYKDMQRLASVECKFIDHFQRCGQCLEQVPEGTQMTMEIWNEKKQYDLK